MIYFDVNTDKTPLSHGELVRIMRGNVCGVLFTKQNGETRMMHCTLMAKHLPPKQESTGRETNTSALAVWDMDKGAWRSFRIDSVKQVTVLEFVN